MTDSAEILSSESADNRKQMERKSFQRKRQASERNFKHLGLGAVLIACAFLVILLSTVVGKGIPAFTHHYVKVPVNFENNVTKDAPETGDYNFIYKKGLSSLFPDVKGRKNKREVRRLVSSGAGIELREQAMADPDLIDEATDTWLPMDDFSDLYMKGLIAQVNRLDALLPFTITREGKILTLDSNNSDGFETVLGIFKNSLSVEIKSLEKKRDRKIAERNTRLSSEQPDQAVLQNLKSEIETFDAKIESIISRQSNFDVSENLTKATPSVLVAVNGGIIKVKQISRNKLVGSEIVPISKSEDAVSDRPEILYISTPERARKFTDIQVGLVENLKNRDLVERRINQIFFTRGASREPEQAGILGALIGSLFTMAVTLALAFPLGVATAIYLEEFAPKNKWTYLIEVNINNLAAVPSIIFGLLGLAVFLNWFNLPRSAPLVGGLVLALMTLPTIIIASRAAIKAVPPSIREAALGIGASKVQVVFHHVLPLAMPGMLTGTIIGMAQALGETAPLLMIGMVAFIVDLPTTFADPATVMPVQIYMWADFPEPAFQQKTAAAIMILLTFLVIMNAIAVLLRGRFERRW